MVKKRKMAKKRKVKKKSNRKDDSSGKDFLFYLDHCNRWDPFVMPVLLENRLTPSEMHKAFPSDFYFLANKNVHCLPKGLHGVLCYWNHKIGVIIKAKGVHAVIRQLLPTPKYNDDDKKCQHIINIMDDGLFLLQQIGGRKISPPNGVEYDGDPPFVNPFLDMNHKLRMSVGGPDVCTAQDVSTILPEYRDILEQEDPFCVEIFYKKKKMPLKVAVVYVLESSLKQRTKVPKKNKGKVFQVPVGDPRDETDRYYLQEFAFLDRDDLLELLENNSMSTREYSAWIRSKNFKICVLVIPRLYKQFLRIKLVTNDEFQEIKGKCKTGKGQQDKQGFQFLTHGDHRFIFGEEKWDLSETPGVLVSACVVHPLAKKPRVTYEFGSAMLKAYGKKGFGPRDISDCLGLNAYRDARLTKRPIASPLVAQEDVEKHQYFNAAQQYPILQAMLEKKLHELTNGAVQVAKALHKPMMELIGDSCTKQIATCGWIPSESDRISTVLGFVNGIHSDKCDKANEKVTKELGAKCSGGYQRRLLDLEGFCFPTTCGYQFLHRDDDSDIEICQYFAMNGLGLGIEVVDGLIHHFLGSAFSHSTCLCIGRRKDRVILNNANDEFLLFAWGRSGGSKQYEATGLAEEETRVEEETMQQTSVDEETRVEEAAPLEEPIPRKKARKT